MSKKDLTYFMREQKDEIITAPAPASFKDENGEPIMLEIKVLNNSVIQKINENYRKRSIATDSKGNPFINNGEVVFKTERDSAKASRHIIVEALQFPNLKDKELMAFYNCVDVNEMPLLVFSKADEYAAVTQAVFAALGMIADTSDKAEDETEEAKN